MKKTSNRLLRSGDSNGSGRNMLRPITAISLKDFLHKQHYVGGLSALLHLFGAGDESEKIDCVNLNFYSAFAFCGLQQGRQNGDNKFYCIYW